MLEVTYSGKGGFMSVFACGRERLYAGFADILVPASIKRFLCLSNSHADKLPLPKISSPTRDSMYNIALPNTYHRPS